jgi:hypothetical protein
LVNRSITNQRESVTHHSYSPATGDHKSQLSSVHLQILQWVETRRAADTRPQVAGLAPLAVDRAVAELVLADLVKAVSIPGSKYDQAHWKPTGLTALGWEALVRYRRSQPRPAPQRWWKIRLF